MTMSDVRNAFHPYADLMPLHDGPDLNALAARIKDYGQREPIVMLNGKILDGRRRALACQMAGIDPIYREFGTREHDGPDPLEFVIDTNLHRRHLTNNERALAAAAYATARSGKPSQSATVKPATNAEAAKRFGITEAQVDRAKYVLEHGTPSLCEAVKNDLVSISDAAKVAGEDEAVQNQAVSDVKSGKSPTASAAVSSAIICPRCSRIGKPIEDCGMCERLRDKEKAKKVVEKLKARNEKPTQFLDGMKNPLPKGLKDVFCDPWLSDLYDQINLFSEEFRENRPISTIDKKGKYYPFIDSKELSDACAILIGILDKISEHIRDRRPWAICPACGGKKCYKCLNSGMVPKLVYEELVKGTKVA